LATKELAVASRQSTLSQFLFHQEIFTKNNTTVVSHSPYFSQFLELKIKLKDRHFNTTEVIEAESQAVLNILADYDFHDAFRKWQKRWDQFIRSERN
jgi:hypothetical protein